MQICTSIYRMATVELLARHVLYDLVQYTICSFSSTSSRSMFGRQTSRPACLCQFDLDGQLGRSLTPPSGLQLLRDVIANTTWPTSDDVQAHPCHVAVNTRKKTQLMVSVSWHHLSLSSSVLCCHFHLPAAVSRSLLASVKEMKLAYYGHILRKKGDCLEKELIQGTTSGSCTRRRPKMTWIDNIKSWSGLSLTELTRKVEDRHQWRKIVHGVANPRNEDS